MTLRKQATLTASTLRASMAGGKRGAPTSNLSGLSCTPLQPVQPEVVLRLRLDTPNTVLSTYVVGHHDIRGGDLLVVGGAQYTVRSVAPWPSPGAGLPNFTELVLEDTRL